MPKFEVTYEHEVVRTYRITIKADSIADAQNKVKYLEFDIDDEVLVDEEGLRINVTDIEEVKEGE
ncbi:hypothetical protein BSP21_073 [Bacillus phage BSP21]|uniref:hypothetical protein n=1 Tax=Bacillus phage SPG24 TaxID=1497851 RepID=UPI0022BA3DA2|nr:hypothetical protein IM043_gp088 [Bacillus phage SPG24]AYJ75408.1 hypothetical protein BSP21_073 [Bacillus phage BSP21]AYJ75810.1 hypothetical protein BSP18_176 [Bacillus phage BSP18]